ncbi:MAG: FkbM family methyltransferase [Cytophagales bacterium]|nr:FkbM family methyltransferase [Cytophagales bacterium]MCA6389624.1 FkbM family methyltransferase [Cytophagales bacterium]MCA6389755.1 FkbM family methyltransferase [Cytophagales bacterium]MCA6393727.1 FkbM family methyltransferase [Cytophagales bacterium]MCA6397811.1 FkbM family methyltransferase [Cytophagales bacterium]
MKKELPFKTIIFNFFRILFKKYPFEKWLSLQVIDMDEKSRLYRLIPHSYTYQENDYRIVTRHDVKLKLYLSDYLGHCLYFQYRNPELESYKKLFDHVRATSICIDVGSNIGYVALVMATIARQGRVIGFEPDSSNYNRLMENFELNNLPNVQVYNLGLGEKCSIEGMEVNPESTGRNKIMLGKSDNKVKIVSLDEQLKNISLDVINLIKIDVEGYELKVLKGGKATLTKYLPIIFIEIDDRNLACYGDRPEELVSLLSEIGYKNFINVQTNQRITASSDFNNVHFDMIASSI